MKVHKAPAWQLINENIETWAFTQAFGDRAIRTWLEILTVAAKNDNVIIVSKGWLGWLQRRVRQHRSRIKKQIEWMLVHGWLSAPMSPHQEELTLAFMGLTKILLSTDAFAKVSKKNERNETTKGQA
jgi:hypothetical protein